MYTELALYGNKNEFAMTDTVFLPIYEVSNGTVSFSLRSKLSGPPHFRIPGWKPEHGVPSFIWNLYSLAIAWTCNSSAFILPCL